LGLIELKRKISYGNSDIGKPKGRVPQGHTTIPCTLE